MGVGCDAWSGVIDTLRTHLAVALAMLCAALSSPWALVLDLIGV